MLKNLVALLIAVCAFCLELVPQSSSAAGLGLGVHLGVTYFSFSPDPTAASTTTTQGGMGFPNFGIHIYGRNKTFGLRSELEYQVFKQNFTYAGSAPDTSTALQNNVFSWLSYATGYVGDLYIGGGGGFGYESPQGGGHVGYAWLGPIVGYDFSKAIGVEVRALVNLNNPSIFNSIYYLFQVNFKVFEDRD